MNTQVVRHDTVVDEPPHELPEQAPVSSPGDIPVLDGEETGASALRAELGLDYEARSLGTLQLFRTAAQLAAAERDVAVLRELFISAIEMGVRPYYVYSTDMVEGAHHFVVPHQRMLELYEGLRGWISGPAVPTFVVDGLGGLGKLPIIPTYVSEETLPDGSGTTVKCRNYKGMTVEMPGLGVNFSLPSHSN